MNWSTKFRVLPLRVDISFEMKMAYELFYLLSDSSL